MNSNTLRPAGGRFVAYLAGAVLLALLGLSGGACRAAEAPLQPFSYHEGFEGQAPQLTQWAKNGESVEAFNGVTEEQACEGKRSLKLDVTLKGGSYHYWGVPVRVPCLGKLKLSARIRLGEGTTARVGFGVNLAFPPTGHTGCGPIESYEKPTNEWKTITCDLVDRGRDGADGVLAANTVNVQRQDVVPTLDRWAIFVYGGEGQRAVVYVDDIRIEGEVPADAAVQAMMKEGAARSQQRLEDRVKGWRTALDGAEASLGKVGEGPASLATAVAAYRQSLVQARTTVDAIAKHGYASRQEIAGIEAAAAAARYAPETMAAITAGEAAGQPYLLYAPRPISNERLSPGAFPIPAPLGKQLSCAGCAGEYEPISVAVYALRDLQGLAVSATDLKGPAGSIPAGAVDIRVVKSWYQAGWSISDTRNKTLAPELLLKDDALVRVDADKQQDFLRSTAADGTQRYLLCSGPKSDDLKDVLPTDAAALQPVDLQARTLRQFWLTVHLPETARPGTYAGAVRFRLGAGSKEIPLRVTVHPFALAPTRIIYSVYYRGFLAPDGRPTISSEGKSEAQYRAEMADMKAHGVLYPTNYMPMDETRLRRALEIRKEAGLPAGPLFNLGFGTGATRDPKGLAETQDGVKKWLAFCKEFGYGPVYFYGTDEASGEQLLAQKASWKAVQDAGGKTFVACYKKTFEAMGGLLNCAVLAGKPDPEETRNWHSVGSQAFCYAYPQVGNEEPETYRRNFGLVLWKAGFDGAMDYAYQHSFGHIWNDFDDKTYRDHVFAYPTTNGVVDTIQWEGFREAVDDTRYLTTLEQAMAKAPAGRRSVADAARAWLDKLDPETADLDEMRAQAVVWIEKLGAR